MDDEPGKVPCSFPECSGYYEIDEDYEPKVAILKDGKMFVFCPQHAPRLIAEGVQLERFYDVQSRLPAPSRKADQDRAAREQAFIDRLKS